MADENKNLIPDRYDPYIAVVLSVIVGLLTLATEGKWFSADVTAWLYRAIAAIAVLSSIFKWGLNWAGGQKDD